MPEYMRTMCVQESEKVGREVLGTQELELGGYELPCGFWESNSGPLQEQ